MNIINFIKKFKTKQDNPKLKINKAPHALTDLENDICAAKIMRPKAHLVAIDINLTPDEILIIISKTKNPYIPVYSKNIDNIIGVAEKKFIYEKIIQKSKTIDLKSNIKQPFFIAPSVSIVDLIIDMHENKIPIAFIIDEFGALDGFIDREDINNFVINRLITVQANFFQNDKFIESQSNRFIINAAIKINKIKDITALYDKNSPEYKIGQIISDVAQKLGKKSKVETIAGMIYKIAGRVPAKNEIIKIENIEFEIVDANVKRITKVVVKNIDQNDDDN